MDQCLKFKNCSARSWYILEAICHVNVIFSFVIAVEFTVQTRNKTVRRCFPSNLVWMVVKKSPIIAAEGYCRRMSKREFWASCGPECVVGIPICALAKLLVNRCTNIKYFKNFLKDSHKVLQSLWVEYLHHLVFANAYLFWWNDHYTLFDFIP